MIRGGWKWTWRPFLYVWAFPNTFLGLVLGLASRARMEMGEDGILRFLDHPWLGTAVSLGHVQIYGRENYRQKDGRWVRNRFGHPVVMEENLHTRQAEVLGPFYLPLHLLFMTLSLKLCGHTHRQNLLEMGPERMAGPWPWQVKESAAAASGEIQRW